MSKICFVNSKSQILNSYKDIDSKAHKMKVKNMILQLKVVVPTELYGSRKATSVSLLSKMGIELETYCITT
jgi:hypothetical protein